ncbi:hypothetical protein YC2023_054448 [Brassica napus]
MSTPWSYWWTQDFGSVATEMDLREVGSVCLGFVVSLARCRVVGLPLSCPVKLACRALSVPFRLFGLHIGSLLLFLQRSSLDLSPVLGASARRSFSVLRGSLALECLSLTSGGSSEVPGARRLSFRKAARHHSHLAMLVLGQAVSSA